MRTDVPLTGGLDLRDPKHLAAGSFAVLDNADFDPVRKRHDHRLLKVSDAEVFDADSTAPDWLYGHGLYDDTTQGLLNGYDQSAVGQIRGVPTVGASLLAWDGWRLLSYDDTPSSRWRRVGQDGFSGDSGVGHVVHAQERSVIQSGPTAKHFEVAVGSHRSLYTWIEGTIAYYAVTSNDTGAVVQGRTPISFGEFNHAHAKPVYLQQPGQTSGLFVVVVDADNANLYYKTYAELDLALGTQGTLVSNRWSAFTPVDLRVYAGKLYATYVANVSSTRTLRLVTLSQAITTTAQSLDDGSEVPQVGPVALDIHPDGTLMVAWESNNGIQCAWYSNDGVHRLYPLVLVSASTADRLSCAFRYLKAGGIYRGTVARQTSDNVTVHDVRGDDGINTSATMKDVKLTHQAHRVGESVFVTVGYDRANTIQQQLVTLAWTKASALVPVASALRTTWQKDDDDGWTFNTARVDVNSENGESYRAAIMSSTGRLLPTATGVVLIRSGSARIDYDYLPRLRTCKVGQSLWFAGGVVKEYDGATFHEAGFLTFPQVSGALVAGGALPTTGPPQYRVYLIWTNARGEQHRSAALTYIAPTPAPGSQTVRLTLPAVPFCTQTRAQWEVYRLDYGESTFKRLATVNDPSAAIDKTYDDTGTDVTSNATDPAPSYTAQGLALLDKLAPPSCTVITEGKGRVWFAGGGVPSRQVAYSRLFDVNEAAAWNEGLTVDVPGAGGVTGLGFLGDWVVVFREGAAFVLGGAGPDNLGQGYFDEPRIAPVDSGCVSPDSVLLLPSGLARQAGAGIRVLTYGLQDIPIGEPVDSAFTDREVVSAAVSPLWEQARFVLDGNETYTVEYSSGRWSRWTLRCNAVTTYNGRIVAGSADSQVLLESTEAEAIGQDGLYGYDFAASTGWLRPATTGEQVSLDWWSLRSSYLGTGEQAQDDLFMRVLYDDRDVGPPQDEHVWRPSSFILYEPDISQPSDGSVFGVGDPTYYRTFGSLELRRRFKRRRASSVRFEFRTIGTGAGLSLIGLALDYRQHNKSRGIGHRGVQ